MLVEYDQEILCLCFSRLTVILVSLLLISACTAVKLGRDFDVGVLASKVEQGMTTQNRLRSWLGEHTSVGVSPATDGERFDQ